MHNPDEAQEKLEGGRDEVEKEEDEEMERGRNRQM